MTLSIKRTLGRGTRNLLVAAVAGVAVLVFVVASAARETRRLAPRVAVAPAPSAVTRAELLAPYTTHGFRNGRRVAIQVVMLGESPVELQTARAFLAMRDDAAAAGISLPLESGFRTSAEQKELYRAWRRGKGNRAAKPGHSNHQSGRALDISVREPATYAWLSSNASQFGFKRTVKGEPWHWEYVNAPRARPAKSAKSTKKPKRGTRPRSRAR